MHHSNSQKSAPQRREGRGGCLDWERRRREGGRHSIARKEMKLLHQSQKHKCFAFSFIPNHLSTRGRLGGSVVVVVGSRPRRYPTTRRMDGCRLPRRRRFRRVLCVTLPVATESAAGARRQGKATDRGFCLSSFYWRFAQGPASSHGPFRTARFFRSIRFFCGAAGASSASLLLLGGSNASSHSNPTPTVTTNPHTT